MNIGYSRLLAKDQDLLLFWETGSGNASAGGCRGAAGSARSWARSSRAARLWLGRRLRQARYQGGQKWSREGVEIPAAGGHVDRSTVVERQAQYDRFDAETADLGSVGPADGTLRPAHRQRDRAGAHQATLNEKDVVNPQCSMIAAWPSRGCAAQMVGPRPAPERGAGAREAHAGQDGDGKRAQQESQRQEKH
jgi:hypothetical protein